MGMEGRYVAMWAPMNRPELAGGHSNIVAAKAGISRWFGENARQNGVFLEMNFRQRDAACLLLMSSGAGSVVLWGADRR
jgi:hypothetical protein